MTRANRKMDRQIQNMQKAEAKQLKEVQALAKKGQHQAGKIVAKNVA